MTPTATRHDMERNMEEATTINVELDDGAFMPERAHATDAGLDLRTPYDLMLLTGQSATVGTGVHVELPRNTCGILVSKSGLNLRGITTTGLIDEGYTGEIKVTIHNKGMSTVVFERGDKISQLVVVPCLYLEPVVVERVSGGERGDSGHGSTGRR